MKSPSQIHLLRGRALCAASLAVLFGVASALAQTTSKSPSSSSSSSSDDRTQQSAQSQPSQSGAAHSAAGNTLNTGAAADVDSTTEINAQRASTEAGAATGRETTSHKLSWGDRRFVTKTAESGKDEVALARLAAERATNSEVKAFAQKLVDDHTKVNEELAGIAGQKGLKLDADDDKDRAYKRLSKKSGLEFDLEFVEHMIDGHENSVKRFEKTAKDAKDADIRSFASKHVDHLREHLRTAESLRASVVPTGRMDDNSGRSTSGAAPGSGVSTSSTGSSDPSSSTNSKANNADDTSTPPAGTATSAGSSSSDTTNSSTTPKRDGSR